MFPLRFCHVIDFLGGRSRTRTYDPLIKSQLLYHLSYAPAFEGVWPAAGAGHWPRCIRGLFHLVHTFGPSFCGPFHIDFGRRFHHHALGLVGAVEMVELARLPARRHLGGLRQPDGGVCHEALRPLHKRAVVRKRGRRFDGALMLIAALPFRLLCG